MRRIKYQNKQVINETLLMPGYIGPCDVFLSKFKYHPMWDIEQLCPVITSP